MKSGDVVFVGLQSWAGLTWHRVTVQKVCPKRIKVKWDDESALSRVHGRTYYVPKAAVMVAA